MFSLSFVINLAFKTDRLESFRRSYPETVLPPFSVTTAVHGDTVKHPDWWHSGNGAWGCYRSHLAVLEHAYNSQADSYVVFEDDAIFRPDFNEQLAAFLNELPADWEMVYLGGQLLHEGHHPPKKVSRNVYIPYNVNRTHCFAVSQRGYEKVYRHLHNVPFAAGEHIDHHLGRLHESGQIKIYCPAKWLVGQDGGPSNISGNNNAAQYWIDPERLTEDGRVWEQRYIPTVFLESTIDIAIELERRGWHRGHWQNAARLDNGVCNAIAGLNMKEDLQLWRRSVIPEAVREGRKCVCLFHPTLTLATVKSLELTDLVQHIVATSADDAERQLDDALSKMDSNKLQNGPARNLIYHIWPKLGNGVWEWNVDQLLKHIGQFDGVRSIAIATSGDAAPAVDVRRAFDGVRVDNWIEMPNDPMGEAATFAKLLETLPKFDGSVTFRGHAKGVKYESPETMKPWTEMLYEICLSDPEYVLASLNHFPTTGPFVVDNRWPEGNKHGWFYSGGFFWFRNADALRQSEAFQIRQDYWGAELWPGSLFKRETEAGTLFGQNCGHLYEPKELARMQQWLAEWRTRKSVREVARCGF